MSKIPQKLTGLRCFEDGEVLLGVVSATLPDPEPMTETISGAGIAGEIESPVAGHFKSMSATITFRTVTASLARLSKSGSRHLELRGSIQVQDAGSGNLVHEGLRVVIKGPAKKTGLGKMEMGKPMDSEFAFECEYLLVELGGKKLIEIDKYNYIHVVDGEDMLKQVRENLGF